MGSGHFSCHVSCALNPHDTGLRVVALLLMFPSRNTIVRATSLRVSHGRSGPSFKTWFPSTGSIQKSMQGKYARFGALSISIQPFQMSGSSENDSSHRSGGESDCEGSAASSQESELSDTRKRRRNKQFETNSRKGMDLTRRDYNKSVSQRFGFYGLRY